MATAIVTGASGYIGLHVVRNLLAQGWTVNAIIREGSNIPGNHESESNLDIFQYDGKIESLIEYFQCINADVTMHLAAAVITNPKPHQISDIIDANIKFGTEVLEAMTKSSTRLFISTGTYWQNYDGTDQYNPVDLYSASKEAFEKIITYYVEAHEIRHINLRLFDVYGADDVRPKLWNLLKRISYTGEELNISAGEQLMDMVYIDDVVSAYLKAFELFQSKPLLKNEIYNVSSSSLMKLKDIVLLYESLLKKKLNLNWGRRPYRQREVMVPNNTYPILPNWEPKVDIKSGLTRLAQ